MPTHRMRLNKDKGAMNGAPALDMLDCFGFVDYLFWWVELSTERVYLDIAFAALSIAALVAGSVSFSAAALRYDLAAVM